MIKYYIYISYTKVDMLFNQIPVDLKKRVAAELKIDLKFISTTFKEAVASETLISKLNLVTKAIEESGDMGDISNPKQYFAGKLDMGWGTPAFMHHLDEPKKEEMVMFGGSPDSEKIVGLVGSRAHMLGEVGNPVHASYARPDFLRKIADGLSESPSEVNSEDMYGAFYATRHAALFWEGETQYVEFTAKTFLSREDILLGSPLYVALASPSESDIAGKEESNNKRWRFWRR